MHARLLPIVALLVSSALLPGTAQAGHDGPHPTPLDVAHAMMPCLDRTVGPSMLTGGDDYFGGHWHEGTPITGLQRVPRDQFPGLLALGYGPRAWFPNDPVEPPLAMWVTVFTLDGRDISDAWAEIVVPCLLEVYPPRP